MSLSDTGLTTDRGSYFDDESDKIIIRAAPAFSEDDFQNMTPDEVEGHRALIDSLKEPRKRHGFGLGGR